MSLDPTWHSRAVGANDAVTQVKSRMKVFLHGAAATPTPLITALCNRQDLEDVSLYHLHLSGDIPFAAPSMKDRFFSISLFVSEAPPTLEFQIQIFSLLSSPRKDVSCTLLANKPPSRHPPSRRRH